ncbi:MAG: hypothetical protein HY327_14265 [Chloroflexi bacterium]|nr:hypothetical protein [Chloroflexota bacterium]
MLRTKLQSLISPLRFHRAAILSAVILLAGMLGALLAQPIPLTYVPGWSAPREFARVAYREPYPVSADARGSVHLAWIEPSGMESRVTLASYADAPAFALTRVATTGFAETRVGLPRLAPSIDGSLLLFFIAKKENAAATIQLMRVSAADANFSPAIIYPAEGILTDFHAAADGAGGAFLIWREQRQGAPAIYGARVDAAGSFMLPPTRLSSETLLLLDPSLIVSDNIAHVFYFADDNKSVELRYRRYDLNGRALDEPRLLGRRPQNSTGSVAGYPLALAADARGNITLVESPGGNARLSWFDREGNALLANAVALSGVRASARVDLLLLEHGWQLTWAEARKRDGRLQIYSRAFDLNGAAHGAETRLTATTTSGAVQPQLIALRDGARRLFWIENIAPDTAALFTADNRSAAEPEVWHRLGFAGDAAFGNLLVTVGTGFFLVIVLLIVNFWRWTLVLLIALSWLRVLPVISPARGVAAFVVLVAALAFFIAPLGEMLGQAPLKISAAAAVVFALTATIFCARIAWEWRSDLGDALRWIALALLWTYVYYWLNAIVLLREAFAV